MANTDTDTNTLVCIHYSHETVGNFNTILANSQLLNAYASLFTKIDTETLYTCWHAMALIKPVWLQMNISLWFITHKVNG